MLSNDETKRIYALRRYGILDTAPEEEFEKIISLVQFSFKVPMAAISFIDAERQWFKASRGLDVSETSRSVAFCDHTIRSDAVLMVPDAKVDPRFETNPLVTGDMGIQSYMGTPLRTPDGQNIGSLCIIGTEPRTFTSIDAEMLADYGHLVMSQLELRQAAYLDDLTGVLAHSAFFQHLDIAFKDYERRGTNSTLAIIDLDTFKAHNDRYGHLVGDQTLQAFVAACAASIRGNDLIGRLGGDEFGVLLRDITPAAAAGVIARMHETISQVTVPGSPELTITASVGHASLNTAVATRDDWFKSADAALYRAKAAGRNQIVSSEE